MRIVVEGLGLLHHATACFDLGKHVKKTKNQIFYAVLLKIVYHKNFLSLKGYFLYIPDFYKYIPVDF
ncbi:hypothetical protein DR864_15245 [Runella rosea]|uniref:Uncharacterized protein n=1 Tax=Runella rosea TaxID=2259595 RepID=A0A344TK36_9BACT|nr:hypothetical protein DR864_15245 [Runella rosea]